MLNLSPDLDHLDAAWTALAAGPLRDLALAAQDALDAVASRSRRRMLATETRLTEELAKVEAALKATEAGS